MSTTARYAWLGMIVTAVLLVSFGHDIAGRVSAIPAEVFGANPFFVPAHALMLYVVAPVIVLASVVLFVSPGLALVLAHGRPGSCAWWIARGFAVSLGLQVVVSTVLKLTAGPITLVPFVAAVALVNVASWFWCMRRHDAGRGSPLPVTAGPDRQLIGGMAAMIVLSVILLLPALFWQDLNADGVEAMEIGRSLSWFVIPRTADASGYLGLGIGMIPMAFGIHWFTVLFGPVEASTRLPIALYLPALIAGTVALIELAAPRRLRGGEYAAVLGAVALFVFVMGFNASYDNYFADLASPTAYELFTVYTMFVIAYAAWSGDRTWFFVAALLSFLARPTGLLFVMLLGVSVGLVDSGRRRQINIWAAGAVAAWLALYIGYEKIYLSMLGVRLGYSGESILTRFQYLRFDHLQQLLWVIIPAGFLPVFGMLWVRRHDPITRSLGLAALAYLAVLYFPAFTNLHHFAPLFLLPVVGFWRMILHHDAPRWSAGAAAAGLVVAGFVSVPRHFEINRVMRELGSQLDFRFGDYTGTVDEFRESAEPWPAVYTLFGPEWQVGDPTREQVGGPHLWYYAVRNGTHPVDANYLIIPPDSGAPAEYTEAGRTDLAVVLVRNMDLWNAHRFREQRTDFRARVFDIPREVRFAFLGVRAGAYQFNVGSLPGMWRLF